jgi:hypothetical protein
MYMERTMYKVLLLSLALVLLGEVMGFISIIRNLLQIYSRADTWPFMPTWIAMMVQVGRMLFALTLLYWAPKFIKQQFPEVA